MRSARTDGTGALGDLVSAPRMILEQFIRGQFPVILGAGMEESTLKQLEYQVRVRTPPASHVIIAVAFQRGKAQ